MSIGFARPHAIHQRSLRAVISCADPSAGDETELVPVRIGELDPVGPFSTDWNSTECPESVHLGIDVDVADNKVEALLVPPLLRCHRGPTPRNLGATLSGLNSGLLVPVPDERPVQGLSPEEADVPGAVARDLTEKTASGQKGVARLDHTELVPFGIGQDDVTFLRALPDIEMGPAEVEGEINRSLLVVMARTRQV